MMTPVVLSVLGALMNVFVSRKADVAKSVGISEEAVGHVGQMVQDFLSRDERALAAANAEIEKARAYDVATQGKVPPVIEFLRGLVRPLITLTAFFWYVYARGMGISLGVEDYSIVGGIMAFWFGFRPFEKRDVQAMEGKK